MERSPPDPTPFVCDVTSIVRPDVRVVDALARLHLAARRRGYRVVLTGAGDELLDLIDLLGVREVLVTD